MSDLQKWQTQLLKVNDLDKFQVFAKKVQRLTDGGVSKKAQPESYKEISEAAQAIADSLTAMGAGSPEMHLQEHAGSPELQVYMAKHRRLVQLLLPYWQGKSVTDCDVGAAIEIQEHIDGMRPARLYMDFENSRYFLEGSEVTLEEAFASGLIDFTRLSKAWQFEQGKLEEYGVNEPRFSGKGLLIEPESTNLATTLPSGAISTQRSGATLLPHILPHGVVAPAILSGEGEGANRVRVDISNPIKDREYHGSVFYKKLGNSKFIVGPTTGSQWVSSTEVNIEELSDSTYRYKHGRKLVDEVEGEVQFGMYFGDNSDRPYNEDVAIFYSQLELDRATSYILQKTTPVTRLPETLTVLTDSGFTIEADEGIQVNGNEITGFGYIRKLEVK